MPLTDIFTNIFAGKAGDLVTSIGNIADKFITTKEEKLEFEQEVTKEVNRHIEAMRDKTIAIYQAQLADVQSARGMQNTALQQNDNASKHYIYWLASFIIFLVFAFDFALFMIHYPTENRDMIVSTSGILNATALVMVLSFFFGSSSNSKLKDETIKKLSE